VIQFADRIKDCRARNFLFALCSGVVPASHLAVKNCFRRDPPRQKPFRKQGFVRLIRLRHCEHILAGVPLTENSLERGTKSKTALRPCRSTPLTARGRHSCAGGCEDEDAPVSTLNGNCAVSDHASHAQTDRGTGAETSGNAPRKRYKADCEFTALAQFFQSVFDRLCRSGSLEMM